MKLIYLLITLLTFVLFSCQINETNENQNEVFTEQLIEHMKSLPDTLLTVKDMNKNDFQADLSEIQIDIERTSKLSGEWIAQNGEISFLNTHLTSGNKVIFYDTVHTSMTGWGIIRYNRAANFYFTESGSYMYEFYVINKDKLVLSRYDYRNDDLTMKEKPEPIISELEIEFVNDDLVNLRLGGQLIELKRRMSR